MSWKNGEIGFKAHLRPGPIDLKMKFLGPYARLVDTVNVNNSSS